MAYSVRKARREATNLSAPGELVSRARELGVNMSAVFERALVAAVQEAEHARWLEENQSAIASYASEVEKHGLFGDRHRTF